MKMGRYLIAAIALGFALISEAQSPLPPDVQADLLRNRILESIRNNDLPTTLDAIDQYKQIKIDFPPVFFVVEAKAAYATRDPRRAVKALEEYMKVADRQSAAYKEA